MRNTFSPTSMPVSRPVRGNGWVGTSAHEHETYQPSAALEIVTVLGVPSMGRDQGTATRPNLERARKPLSSRTPLPDPFWVKELTCSLRGCRGKTGDPPLRSV